MFQLDQIFVFEHKFLKTEFLVDLVVQKFILKLLEENALLALEIGRNKWLENIFDKLAGT